MFYMNIRYCFPILVVIAGFVLSCSGSGNPVQIDTRGDLPKPLDYLQTNPGDNTIILGAWEIYIDLESGTVDAVPLRTAEVHVNVTPWLTPPKCYDCFLAKNLIYDPDTKIFSIDIGFKNPTNLTGFDIRGIVTQFGFMELLNPDGWTELFPLIPGDRNPFVAYKTGIGQREFPGQTKQYENLVIYNPNFPTIPPFKYVVEASWPDNCKEPYEIIPVGVSGNLYADGSNSPLLQVYARDWQDNIESVIVDLSPIGGTTASLTENIAVPDLWEGPISCAPGTLIGEYELWIQATTSAPFDQTALMHNKTGVEVVDAPVPQIEVFNPPKLVASTQGESFIWPRHAISTGSDGQSHIVWVDNQPDPESVQFHVYYSQGSGDIWSSPKQIDSAEGYAIYATIALDSSDNAHIVWEDQRDHVLGSDIYYASSIDNFASETILVTGDAGLRNVHPRLEIGNDDKKHLVWHSYEIIDISNYEYDVWYMSGTDVWSAPEQVSAEIGISEAYPAVAPGPGGSAYVTWHSNAAGPNGIYFAKNFGGPFEAPVTVSLDDAYQPAIDVDPTGKILIAYFDYLDGTFTDINLRISSDMGGTWGPPQLISESNDYYQYAPDVEASPDGDYHVAWHEEDDMGIPGNVLYREMLSTGDWQPITTISGGLGAFPSMDSDLDGHIHIVYQLWTLYEPPGQNNYEIYYRDSVP